MKTKKIQLRKPLKPAPNEVPRYSIFRRQCPELSQEQFEGMRAVVCGFAFSKNRMAPEA